MRRAMTISIAALLGYGSACSTGTSRARTEGTGTSSEAGPAGASADAAAPPAAPALRLAPGARIATTAGVELKLVSHVVETIAPDPEEASAVGGEGVVATLVIGDDRVELSALPDGYGSQRDAWTRDAHVRLVDAGGPPSQFIAVHAYLITDRVVAGSERDFVVERGGSAEIGPGTHLAFLGHGHKTVSTGQRSPLIVNVEYRVGDERETASYSLDPPENNRFTWRDYAFDLTAHEYDRSMTLAVRRFALEPLVAAGD